MRKLDSNKLVVSWDRGVSLYSLICTFYTSEYSEARNTDLIQWDDNTQLEWIESTCILFDPIPVKFCHLWSDIQMTSLTALIKKPRWLILRNLLYHWSEMRHLCLILASIEVTRRVNRTKTNRLIRIEFCHLKRDQDLSPQPSGSSEKFWIYITRLSMYEI